MTPTWIVARKLGWLGDQAHQLAGDPVAFLGLFADLVVIQGDDGNFGRRKKGIDQDQDCQDQQIKDQDSSRRDWLGCSRQEDAYMTAIVHGDESPSPGLGLDRLLPR